MNIDNFAILKRYVMNRKRMIQEKNIENMNMNRQDIK